MKTRYSKPFEDIEVRIPWDKGMDPYSGLFDLIEKKGMVTREGNRYAYVDANGEIHKYFRKEWLGNTNGVLDHVMVDFAERAAKAPAQSFDDTVDVVDEVFDEAVTEE
jgi:hypothetical protein